MMHNKPRSGIYSNTPPTGSARASRLAGRLLLAALFLLLGAMLFRVAFSTLQSAAFFSYPYQFDESEGMIVAETQLLDRGFPIYDRPQSDLFVAAPYPPLFYLLAWPGQHLAGSDPTFKVGRAISIGGMLLSALAIFGIVAALTRNKLAGILASAVWLSLGLVTFWGSLVKPDILALALGLCGLWWALAKPPRQIWWALPFFWAAFLTKQTAIAAGVACAAWLVFTRPRVGLLFGGLLAAGAALPGVVYNEITNGGYYYHLYTVHDLPWFPGRYQEFVLGLLATYGAFIVPGISVLVAFGVAALVRRLRGMGDGDRRDPYLLLFFYLGMALFASVGAGTLGGNHNHLLDLVAASMLGLGAAFGVAAGSERLAARIAGVALAALLLVSVPSLFGTPKLLARELRVLLPDYRQGMDNVFQYVTNNGGTAYSDNVGLMLLAHKKLWTTDPFTQTHATKYGRWDQSRLLEAIRTGRFSQIVIRIEASAADAGAGDVSPEILQAVRDNYKLDQRNVENIYVPR